MASEGVQEGAYEGGVLEAELGVASPSRERFHARWAEQRTVDVAPIDRWLGVNRVVTRGGHTAYGRAVVHDDFECAFVARFAPVAFMDDR